MIENKCREWYHSEECTVHSLVEYIEKTGKMRDAQVEAIKLYLLNQELKIEMAKETPLSNLARTARIEPQYKSSHVRTLDNHEITLHHLFFDFASS